MCYFTAPPPGDSGEKYARPDAPTSTGITHLDRKWSGETLGKTYKDLDTELLMSGLGQEPHPQVLAYAAAAAAAVAYLQ